MTNRYLDNIPPGYCPECCAIITGKEGGIQDCVSHISHTELVEHYRWLKGENQRSEARFHELVKGTAIENILFLLKEANQSRAKLGAERYLLEKRVEELESRSKYWKATAEEYEKALRSATEAMKEATRVLGGGSGK